MVRVCACVCITEVFMHGCENTHVRLHLYLCLCPVSCLYCNHVFLPGLYFFLSLVSHLTTRGTDARMRWRNWRNAYLPNGTLVSVSSFWNNIITYSVTRCCCFTCHLNYNGCWLIFKLNFSVIFTIFHIPCLICIFSRFYLFSSHLFCLFIFRTVLACQAVCVDGFPWNLKD